MPIIEVTAMRKRVMRASFTEAKNCQIELLFCMDSSQMVTIIKKLENTCYHEKSKEERKMIRRKVVRDEIDSDSEI